jgi:hypothetical protein
MEITTRSLWTLIHGMGFGALYLMACSGALVELYRRYCTHNSAQPTGRDEAFLRVYLALMAALAWLAVITGSYIIYPWYRAKPPAGTTNLAAYPRYLLLSSPTTSAWHNIGMEWKEYIAWVVPIAISMAAAVVLQYGRRLKDQPSLRNAVLCFVWASLVSAGVAGFFGAMINKNAPVEGGGTIHIVEGDKK